MASPWRRCSKDGKYFFTENLGYAYPLNHQPKIDYCASYHLAVPSVGRDPIPHISILCICANQNSAVFVHGFIKVSIVALTAFDLVLLLPVELCLPAIVVLTDPRITAMYVLWWIFAVLSNFVDPCGCWYGEPYLFTCISFIVEFWSSRWFSPLVSVFQCAVWHGVFSLESLPLCLRRWRKLFASLSASPLVPTEGEGASSFLLGYFSFFVSTSGHADSFLSFIVEWDRVAQKLLFYLCCTLYDFDFNFSVPNHGLWHGCWCLSF